MISEMPMIRLEVQHMKQSILHAMAAYNERASEHVAAEIDAALSSFDWSGVVRETVHQCVAEAIEHYFKYGEGRQAINAAIASALAGPHGTVGRHR